MSTPRTDDLGEMLLRLVDLPGGWIQSEEPSIDDDDAGVTSEDPTCQGIIDSFPSEVIELTVGYINPTKGLAMNHRISVYESPEDGEATMATLMALGASCTTLFDDDGRLDITLRAGDGNKFENWDIEVTDLTDGQLVLGSALYERHENIVSTILIAGNGFRLEADLVASVTAAIRNRLPADEAPVTTMLAAPTPIVSSTIAILCARTDIDFASLRIAPGVDAQKLAEIPAGDCSIELLNGDPQDVGGTRWLPVVWNGIEGWTALSNMADEPDDETVPRSFGEVDFSSPLLGNYDQNLANRRVSVSDGELLSDLLALSEITGFDWFETQFVALGAGFCGGEWESDEDGSLTELGRRQFIEAMAEVLNMDLDSVTAAVEAGIPFKYNLICG